jgi:hypothetical protein
MNTKRFCELYSSYYGLHIDKIEQIKTSAFEGKELFHFVNYFTSKEYQNICPETEGWYPMNDPDNDLHIPEDQAVEIKFAGGFICDYDFEPWPFDEVTHWRLKQTDTKK